MTPHAQRQVMVRVKAVRPLVTSMLVAFLVWVCMIVGPFLSDALAMRTWIRRRCAALGDDACMGSGVFDFVTLPRAGLWAADISAIETSPSSCSVRPRATTHRTLRATALPSGMFCTAASSNQCVFASRNAVDRHPSGNGSQTTTGLARNLAKRQPALYIRLAQPLRIFVLEVLAGRPVAIEQFLQAGFTLRSSPLRSLSHRRSVSPSWH